MKPITIIKATIADLHELQRIGRQTFQETFADSNSDQNMKSYLEEGFSIIKLTAELQNEDSEFYFAKIDNEVIGYLKINFGESQTELRDSTSLEIERIYVSNEFHGKSVGQSFMTRQSKLREKRDLNMSGWESGKRI